MYFVNDSTTAGDQVDRSDMSDKQMQMPVLNKDGLIAALGPSTYDVMHSETIVDVKPDTACASKAVKDE